MTTFTREPRYVVFKGKDILKYLTQDQRNSIQSIGEYLDRGRERDGRPPFNAVVVEEDWPEFDMVWAAIEKRMTGIVAGDTVPHDSIKWQPIDTAPKDNKHSLYLAKFNSEGKLLEIDFDGGWEYEQGSWDDLGDSGYTWVSANGIEEPTHWAYQWVAPPLVVPLEAHIELDTLRGAATTALEALDAANRAMVEIDLDGTRKWFTSNIKDTGEAMHSLCKVLGLPLRGSTGILWTLADVNNQKETK